MTIFTEDSEYERIIDRRYTSSVRKKRDQNVFCNISYKTRAIVMEFDTQFPE